MNLTFQVLVGTGLFLVAAFLQLASLVRLSNFVQETESLGTARIARLLAVIVSIHLIQIAIWALALWIIVPALAVFSDAFYFTLVTYTTVGYGDLTLGSGSRILGAMAAFAGILGFGMSTAFLVSVFARVNSSR